MDLWFRVLHKRCCGFGGVRFLDCRLEGFEV